MNKSHKLRQDNYKKLSLAAIFIALSIVFARLLYINIVVFRFSFAPIPLHLAGYLLGPVWGFLVGAMSDLIGVMINSQGTMHWGITLVSALQATIPGLVILFNRKKLDIKSIIISNIFTTAICSLLLMTIFLAQLQGKGFNALFEVRVLNSSLQGLLYMIIEILLLPVLKSIEKYLPDDVEVKSFR